MFARMDLLAALVILYAWMRYYPLTWISVNKIYSTFGGSLQGPRCHTPGEFIYLAQCVQSFWLCSVLVPFAFFAA